MNPLLFVLYVHEPVRSSHQIGVYIMISGFLLTIDSRSSCFCSQQLPGIIRNLHEIFFINSERNISGILPMHFLVPSADK